MRVEAVQLQVREELLYHRRFENGRDDLELTTAVRAVLKVDLEYPFEQPGPADARRRPCVQPGLLAGDLLGRLGHPQRPQLRVRRQHTVIGRVMSQHSCAGAWR